MKPIGSWRAGKRVCARIVDGKCVSIVPVPPQEDLHDLQKLIKDGQVMSAGTACRLGYISCDELITMFPYNNAVLQSSAKLNTRHHKITKEKTYVTRWGLTDERYPQWEFVTNKGPSSEKSKRYLRQEERRTIFQITVDDDGKDTLLTCKDQICTPVRMYS